VVANFIYQACNQFHKPLKKLTGSAKALSSTIPGPATSANSERYREQRDGLGR